MPKANAVLCTFVLVMTLSFMPAARAQDHSPEHAQSHAQGHDEYVNWASERTDNCCNNQDCGALRSDQWRETPKGTEILIRGQWCPVKKEHFIRRGKSPDWNVAHACVLGDNHTPANLCDRLLCFSGRGQW